MGSLIPGALSVSIENWVPKTISEFMAEVSSVRSISDKILKLDYYISRLQDELKKIDVFKRELPLCMLLLKDAIETMKEEMQQCGKSNVEPKLKEFIPLKKIEEERMVSVQLCTSYNQNQQQNTDRKPSNKMRKGGVCNRPGEEAALSLHTPEIKIPKEKMINSLKPNEVSELSIIRKQRRCWSPELHRRFVNALQHLGGAQAATPKLIRELMRVDGLTNDEVKSHLQKYRLHSRSVANPQNRAIHDLAHIVPLP